MGFTGFICIIVGNSGLILTRQWIYDFHRRRTTWLIEGISAFQERQYYMELDNRGFVMTAFVCRKQQNGYHAKRVCNYLYVDNLYQPHGILIWRWQVMSKHTRCVRNMLIWLLRVVSKQTSFVGSGNFIISWQLLISKKDFASKLAAEWLARLCNRSFRVQILAWAPNRIRVLWYFWN
jgi:hypothetical protein